MAHKYTQKEIDTVINLWRGKHAVEKMVAEYDGSKWSKYQRFRLEGGFIFHIATDTLKLTITPPDATTPEQQRISAVHWNFADNIRNSAIGDWAEE